MNWFINFLKTLFFPKKEEINKDFPGCLLPLPDYRDILGSSLLQETPIPANYRIPYQLKVKDQNGKPYCVAYSSALIKEVAELREQNDREFDPSWLYLECKKIDNYSGPGTYLNMPFKVMLHKGIKPLNETEADMAKYRIGGYAAIDDLSHEGLKRAIYQWGAIIAGYSYSRQGWANEYIRPPKTGETIVGHSVALIGWDSNCLIGQNSFGKDWGREGIFFVPKDYEPFSAYAILIDLPNNWKELLPNPNQKPHYIFNNNLSVGMNGTEIKILQDCLKWIGAMKKSQESTGYFGSITKDAVILFQKRYGILPASGFVGIITRKKLNSIFSITK